MVTGRSLCLDEEKHEGKHVNLISGGSAYRYPSIRVEKSLCVLCRKRANKLHSYSNEQVHLWTCRTVETLTGRFLGLSERQYEIEQVGS